MSSMVISRSVRAERIEPDNLSKRHLHWDPRATCSSVWICEQIQIQILFPNPYTPAMVCPKEFQSHRFDPAKRIKTGCFLPPHLLSTRIH